MKKEKGSSFISLLISGIVILALVYFLANIMKIVGLVVGVIALALAIYFYTKKNHQYFRVSTMISGIAFVAMIIGFVVGGGFSNDKDVAETDSNSVSSSAVSKQDNSSTTSSSSTDETKADKYESINSQLAEHLLLNQGWAMGSIDSDGNPIENGTPNPDYAIWPFVQSVTWDGSEARVQVTADFESFTTQEKDRLASSAQGMVSSYAGLDRLPFVAVYNGDNSYGHSKATAPNEYKWY